MTPEERLNKIESLLQATAERQAQQQLQTEKQNEAIRGLISAADKRGQEIEKQNEAIRGLTSVAGKHGQEIEKQNEGIRNLIVVARTLLDSMQEFREDHNRFMVEMEKLREAQAATDEKLNILIETVDLIIRRRNGKQ